MAGIGRAGWPLLVALFCAGYVAGAVSGIHLSGWLAGLILLLVGVLLLLGTYACCARVAAFFKGAAGEEQVARVLGNLPAGFEVFHSLELGGGVLMWRQGDLDHLVVGPTGAFAIETKNWQGRVTLTDEGLLLDGRRPRRAPLAQVRQAVAALQLRLGRAGVYHVPIVPVVCFASDRFTAPPQMVADAIVCNRADLQAILTKPPSRAVAPADVAGLVRALTDSRPA
jgi:hypothetical protein